MSIARVDKISFSTAGFGETLTHDLAFAVPSALSFFPAQRTEDVIKKIGTMKFPRAEVAAVIDATARRFNAPDAVLKNISLLRDEKTYVIATGQQAGFLGGPLFTLHKALSTIQLAKKLEAEAQGGARFVPIFWIAGDDHDLAEIDHAEILQSDGTLANIRAPLAADSEGRSVCDVFLDRDEKKLAELRSALGAALKDEALAAEYVALYSKHSFSDAFMALMTKWLGETGLICVQSSDMRRFGTELLLRELSEYDITSRLIQEASVALQSARYKPGFSNTGRQGPHFFITSEPTKVRANLDPIDGERFQERSQAFAARGVQPQRFTKAELAEIIRTHPERFSCAAALRPALQDKIFPVVATVLGPGEIAYWAQLRKVHEHFGAVWPIIVPRATITLIDAAGEKALRKLGISANSPDIFLDGDLLAKKVLVGGNVNGGIEARSARINAELAAMEAEVLAADAGLKSLFEKSRERIAHELGRIAEKTNASLRQRDGAGEARAAYLSSLVRPRKSPQERVLSVGPFMAKFPSLAADLAGVIDVPPREHLVVTLA